ncbi:MAG: SDR family NAD(P)-dependent oxidoreductase [Bacteroidales bacterium]|nr:SDR family NAD(P)-dependent oxidoreductase [Bacteroidales bacterium]
MPDNRTICTLITGGSAGIGRAFAEICARKGMNLFLVALPDKDLIETGEFIRNQWKVHVETLGIDLTEKDAPEKVYQYCIEHNLKVNILINNAGRAGTAIFEESSLHYSDERILLNIRALVLLTRLFLPMLKESEKSFILNIASLSGYYPIPYKTVYSASKAFVIRFSLALAEELRNSSVQVSVVCPNGVETNPGTYGRIRAHGFWGDLSKIDRFELADYTLDKMFRGKNIIVPKWINRFFLFLAKITPLTFQMRLLRKEFEKEVKVSR